MMCFLHVGMRWGLTESCLRAYRGSKASLPLEPCTDTLHLVFLQFEPKCGGDT